MDTQPPLADPVGAYAAARVEFRLIVWVHPSHGWRARLIGADASERDFASPFELVRFVSWPVRVADGPGSGLR